MFKMTIRIDQTAQELFHGLSTPCRLARTTNGIRRAQDLRSDIISFLRGSSCSCKSIRIAEQASEDRRDKSLVHGHCVERPNTASNCLQSYINKFLFEPIQFNLIVFISRLLSVGIVSPGTQLEATIGGRDQVVVAARFFWDGS